MLAILYTVKTKGGNNLIKEQNNLIDHQTIAIEAFSSGDYRTKITKTNGIFYSEQTPIKLLDEACMNEASTLEGRIQAVMKIFNFYKPPIIIAPFSLSLFPTASYNNYECEFIFNHPFQIIDYGNGKYGLLFYNSIEVPVNASKHTLIQQHLRLHTVINYFRDFKGNTWIT